MPCSYAVPARGLPAASTLSDKPAAPLGAITFVLNFRCGTKALAARFGENDWGLLLVSKNRYHAREAAVALLKMAKTTSDPAVAAGLIEAAVKLKDEAGELPPPVGVKAPDVQPEGEPPEAGARTA